MVRVSAFFGMTLGVFVFLASMDRLHVWYTLYQDEKKERLEKEAESRAGE